MGRELSSVIRVMFTKIGFVANKTTGELKRMNPWVNADGARPPIQ
jgi:hypothetical protein